MVNTETKTKLKRKRYTVRYDVEHSVTVVATTAAEALRQARDIPEDEWSTATMEVTAAEAGS